LLTNHANEIVRDSRRNIVASGETGDRSNEGAAPDPSFSLIRPPVHRDFSMPTSVS
jgi:hypothetical protein